MKITLLSKPDDIHRTLAIMWQASKTVDQINLDPLVSPKLLKELIEEAVPIIRHFYFTFLIEDMPIEFREQLVRTQYDHYWIQSGRITNWTTASIPVKGIGSLHTQEVERKAIKAIREYFEEATADGINPEDYRHLVPVGALHRGIWTVNMESLITRLRKRSCWVAQAGHWHDCLSQVVQELKQVGIILPVRPPCRDRDGNHTGCTIAGTMRDRIEGRDPLSPCPLFVRHEGARCDWGPDDDSIPTPETRCLETVCKRYANLIQHFEDLWGRNYVTGS